MNPDSPKNQRETLEARLTSLLLGELSHEEAASLHQDLSHDPELSKLYDRLQETIGVVRETMHAPAEHNTEPAEPLRLSDERREKLLAHFKTVAPSEFEKPKGRATRVILELAIAASIVVILGGLMLPALSKAKAKAQRVTASTEARLLEKSVPSDSVYAKRRAEYAARTSAAGKPDSSGTAYSFGAVGYYSQSNIPGAAIHKDTAATDQPPAPLSAPPMAMHDGRKISAGSFTLSDSSSQRRSAIVLPAAEPSTATAVAGSSPDGRLQTGTPATHSDISGRVAMSQSTAAPAAGHSGSDKPAVALKFRTWSLENEGDLPPIAVPPKPTDDAPDANYLAMQGRAVTSIIQTAPAQPIFKPESVVAQPERLNEGGVVIEAVNGLEETKNFGAMEGRISDGAAASTPAKTPSYQGLAKSDGFDATDHNPATPPPTKQFGAGDIVLFNNRAIAPAGNARTKVESNPTSQLFAYQNAKEDLEQKKRFSQILDKKIAGEKIDVDLPKSTMVEIVDRAVPPTQKSSSLWDRLRGDSSRDYSASTRIKAGRDQSDVSGFYDRNLSGNYDPYFIQTEFELIQSKPLLEKIVKDQKLAETWSKESGKPVTTEEAVEKLKSHLELRPVGKTSLIDIKVRSDNPSEAAALANGIADAYQAARKKNREELSRRGISALEERIKEQEVKIASAQSNVNYLRQNLGVSDAAAGEGPSPLMTGETLRRIESLRIEGKTLLDEQLTLLGQLRDVLNKPGHDHLAPASAIAANDTVLNSLLEQCYLAQQKLVSVEKKYGPQHPEMITARAQLEDLRMQLTNRVDSLLLDLEGKEAANQKSLAALEAEVTAVKPKPATNPLIPQPEIPTADNAFSTFSLNVSDVAFKLAAASLEKGELPDAGSMRSEEFINAFDYRDPEPQPGVAVAFASERAQYPFAQNRDLLRFSVKTAALGRAPGKPLNLVLLLDNSGSMERADRVQIIREALRVLAGQLQPQDKLSIVTFARTAQLRIDGIPGSQATNAVDQVAGLTPEGGTNLEEAMKLAYATALRHYLANGVNRVVLLTDGAANLGDVSPASLKQQVEAHRKQGVALDCFGIGWEGYNDDLLEELSRNGDGRYGFINTPAAAATEFAGQLAGALHVAASDVKVQVEFNPKRVTSWRQIGYARHQLTKEQFRDNTVDAAEIGAAESGNALYVIEVNPKGEGPIATVRARYKTPGTEDYREHEWPVAYNGSALPLDQSSSAMRLAAAAGAFSEWLAASPYAGETNPDRLLGYLNGVPEKYGADPRPKQLEWMIRQAKSLTGK
jgi:Mg-chelatase subunit ChlD